MADICVFGSPAWDIVYRLGVFPAPGGQAQVQALGGRPGGSAANVARGLRSAGHAVMLLGRLGDDDIGRRLEDELIAWDVGTEHLERHGTSAQALLFIDASGERTIFPIVQHSQADAEATNLVPLPHAALTSASCVYLDEYETLPSHLPAMLDDSPAFIVTGAPNPDVQLWPANLVIASARHFPPAWIDAPFERAQAVIGARLAWVVLTHGAEGAVAYGVKETVRFPVARLESVDATGAGDAFAAGLVHGLVSGLAIRRSLKIASAWGALATQQLQSVPPPWSQVTAMRQPR
jgi:sugar/nucleoside kinase (ribokinase family)